MNWKTNLQVHDLEPTQRLEVTCKVCGHVHYRTRAQIVQSPEREFLYLGEVERETVCRARGCLGPAWASKNRFGAQRGTSGFVGGLA